MADIKDFKRNQFLVEKEEKTPIKEKGTLNSRIARHRMLTFYKICAVFGIVAAIAIYAYYDWKNTVYVDYEVQQQYDWSKSSEAHSMNLNGTLFSYSKDGMSCTDNHGKVIWNQTYEMQNPMVRTCQNVVAVGDYNEKYDIDILRKNYQQNCLCEKGSYEYNGVENPLRKWNERFTPKRFVVIQMQ